MASIVLTRNTLLRGVVYGFRDRLRIDFKIFYSR